MQLFTVIAQDGLLYTFSIRYRIVGDATSGGIVSIIASRLLSVSAIGS